MALSFKVKALSRSRIIKNLFLSSIFLLSFLLILFSKSDYFIVGISGGYGLARSLISEKLTFIPFCKNHAPNGAPTLPEPTILTRMYFSVPIPRIYIYSNFTYFFLFIVASISISLSLVIL